MDNAYSSLPVAGSQIAAKLQQANALHQRGQLSAARRLYAEILKFDPRHFDALHMSGVIAAQTQEPRRALEWIDKALRVNPRHAGAHCNRATALQALKRPEAALASYDRAVALQPDHAIACCNRANVLAELGRSSAALAGYEQALALKADYPEAHFGRGNVQKTMGRLDEALLSYERALALRPAYPHAQVHRGNVLKELGRRDAALAAYQGAIALDPRCYEAHFNLGNMLAEACDFEAALVAFDRTLAIRPDHAAAHCNRGSVLKLLGRLGEAIVSFDRAIAHERDFAEAHFNRGTTLLLAGRMAAAWRDYEWRHRLGDRAALQDEIDAALPAWSGRERLTGKTLIVSAEQGLGDTIQFARYLSLVAERGARIFLRAPLALHPLFEPLPHLVGVLLPGQSGPAADYRCRLLSLPRAFATSLETIPAAVPYLEAPAERLAQWHSRLGEKRTKPRVGLVWSGNPLQVNDRNRSLRLAQWLPLLPDGIDYVSVQKELRDHDRDALESRAAILPIGAELRDFADTAAVCRCLDLLISVDTSVAHLGGALGVPLWVLLSQPPDWRWLLDRDDSPWYPTARLFRQPTAGDWSGVLERVRAELIRRFALAESS